VVARAHELGAWAVVLSHAFVGSWALAANRLPALRVRALWVATVAAEVLVFVQIVLGVVAMQQLPDGVEVADLHMFYGFLCIVSIGIIVSYRQQLEAQRHLLYGLGGLWIMGLAIRAMTLGPLAG
jgi:hypothetical protein